MEHFLDSGPNFIVLHELSPVELVQTFLDLLPEPLVMLDVLFHKQLDVSFGIAVVLGRRSFDFRLQLGCQS
jgi:hypothetical protein